MGENIQVTENYHELLWMNGWKERLDSLKVCFESLLLLLPHVTLDNNFLLHHYKKLTVTAHIVNIDGL